MIGSPISWGDGRPGYVARPPAGGPWPGLVVIHEIFGLNDDVRLLSDRLARMGYLALAPDFYGGGNWRKCMKAAFRELDAGSGGFFEAIDAARSWLGGLKECSGRVGVIGFCLGGSFALLSASRYDFAVASVNYGEVPDDPETVLDGACPIVASYGRRDRTLHGHPERLARALTADNVEHDLEVYPDAGHAFLAERRWPIAIRLLASMKGMHPGPHAPSAEDAWRRIDAFFDRHLR